MKKCVNNKTLSWLLGQSILHITKSWEINRKAHGRKQNYAGTHQILRGRVFSDFFSKI